MEEDTDTELQRQQQRLVLLSGAPQEFLLSNQVALCAEEVN